MAQNQAGSDNRYYRNVTEGHDVTDSGRGNPVASDAASLHTVARKPNSFKTRHPEKVAAHREVAKAILRGDLKRPERCSMCYDACRPQAHHDDYTDPLSVRWVCRRCHRIADGQRAHREMVEARTAAKPMLTVKDVATLLNTSYKATLHKLGRGTFPIRHADRTSEKEPYRFTASDVAAYVERGEVTNPLILHNQKTSRRYFRRAS